MARMVRTWGLQAAGVAAAVVFALLAGPTFGALSLMSYHQPPPPPECGTCEYPKPGKPACKPQSPSQGQSSQNPVVYGTGRNGLSVSELGVSGMDGWSHGRSYLTDLAYGDGLVGPGWRVGGLMQLAQNESDILVISGAATIRAFVWTGSSYANTMFYTDTLVADAVNHTLIYTSDDGNQWTFFDFTTFWNPQRRGKLKQFTSEGGNLTTFIYSTTAGPTLDKVLEVQQTLSGAPTTYTRFVYAYNLSGVASGLLSSVTYQRSLSGVVSTVRKVDYTYYATTGPNGPAGTLQWAKITDGANLLDVYYHRYNALDGSGRLPLRYVVTPHGYERAKATLGSDSAIDAASDATIAQWADYYFEYDGNLRVTKEVVQGKGCGCGTSGGKGTYTFAYTSATHGLPIGPNTWKTKAVETLPDGNQKIVYTSGYGATMLEIFKEVATGNQWRTWYRYDAQGRQQIKMNPSGMLGHDEALSDLVGFSTASWTGTYVSSSQGLRTWYDYDAQGNKSYDWVSQGQSGQGGGTALVYRSWVARTGATGTVYKMSSEGAPFDLTGGWAYVNHAYTWQGSTNQIASRVTTFDAVAAADNGSGVVTSRDERYDVYGRRTWLKDEDGFIHATEYDGLTSAVSKQIVDVNTTTATNEPSGWAHPAGGGLHLTTSFEIDALGRTTRLTDPLGQLTYTVYRDPQHEVRHYAGWNTSTNLPTGPTQVMREDRSGGYKEQMTMSATPSMTGGRPTGTEAISSIQSLSRDYLDTGDRATHSDSYFSLSGVTYSTAVNLGTLGTHYHRRFYNYDARGRKDRDQDWTGTVRRSVFDALDRPKSSWIGTDDTPTSGDWSPMNTAGTNLVKVSEDEYDANGVGDGYRTKSKLYTSSTLSLDTLHQYDYRGRAIGSRGPDKVAVKRTYDGRNRIWIVETYADADSNFVIGAAELRGKAESKFDKKGQLFRTIQHNVHPLTGVIGNRLTQNTWFNARGMVVKKASPNGIFSKRLYDGSGRVMASFTSYHSTETAYADAADVVGDTVISQSVLTYDAAGRVIQTTNYERTDSSAKTGDLSASWTETDSRRTYGSSWYDLANRTTSVVNYGRNGGTALSRPVTAPAPNTSDAYIVTKMDYNAAGRHYRSTNNKSRITEQSFDLLGRTTKTVENYVDGVVGNAEYESDRTTEQIFDGTGMLSQLKTRNPKGTLVEDQVTTYVYGTDANVVTPAVYRNDVLVGEIYPDSDDTYNPAGAAGAKFGAGTDATYDRVEYTYDYASRRQTRKLQLTTLHTYVYDNVGRLSQDQLTTLGSGIDGAVRRIVTTYDDLSRRATVSSYSTATGGTLLNQVAYSYDGWGQETNCTQGHEGTATGAPGYTKTFVDGAVSGEAKYVRQSSATFPNGRVVYSNYPATGSLGERMSRVDNIANDASGTLKFSQYTYLGTGAVVKVGHPQVTGGFNLDLGIGTGNPGGWDDFGRIDDQKWQSDASAIKDQYQYGYDRTSNRTFRDNLTATGKDHYYPVDGLDRVTAAKQGDLNAGRTDITGTPAFQEAWTLDGLGNWAGLVQTTAGTVTLNQTRTYTKANETAVIAATVGTNWGDGVLDRNGNMTRVPKPSTPNQLWRLTYDGWGRLVRVVDNVSPNPTIAEYKYDGLNRRIAKLKFLTSTTWDRRDYYYSCEWQVVEERELLNQTSKTVVATLPKHQYVWDLRYIDALILRDENKDGDGDCVDGADQRLYYAQDANFNVTALLDTSGNVVERVLYDAYGRHTLYQANWSTVQASTLYNNEVLYSGYRLNAESGMYQVRNREYHPTLGRWSRRDPMNYHDGANLYEYVSGQAQNALDPMGLQLVANLPAVPDGFKLLADMDDPDVAFDDWEWRVDKSVEPKYQDFSGPRELKTVTEVTTTTELGYTVTATGSYGLITGSVTFSRTGKSVVGKSDTQSVTYQLESKMEQRIAHHLKKRFIYKCCTSVMDQLKGDKCPKGYTFVAFGPMDKCKDWEPNKATLCKSNDWVIGSRALTAWFPVPDGDPEKYRLKGRGDTAAAASTLHTHMEKEHAAAVEAVWR